MENLQNEQIEQKQEKLIEKSESSEESESSEDFNIGIRSVEMEDLFPGGFGNFGF